PDPLHVRALTAHVLRPHVDDALEAEAGADGGRRHAVLPSTRLGDNAVLSEAAGERGLAERVVQLVRARVEGGLALEVGRLPRRKALGNRQRRRPAGVGPSNAIELISKALVLARLQPGRFQVREGRNERLRHDLPAVAAVRQHRAARTNARTRSWS